MSSPSAQFSEAVDITVDNIVTTLNGSEVSLNSTFYYYFRAVAMDYYNRTLDSISDGGINLDLTSDQYQCGLDAVFDHVYPNADAIDIMIEYIQNISRIVAVIRRV